MDRFSIHPRIGIARLGNCGALAEYDRRQDVAFDQYCDTRIAYYRMEARWPSAPFWHRRHRAVSLDPSQRLVAVPGARVPRLLADLRHVCATRLLALAAPGGPSHELAARYRAGAARPVRDLGLVLALQWLIANRNLVRQPDHELALH